MNYFINITSFAVSDVRLWLEEDNDLDTDHFISNKAILKIFVYSQSAIISFISLNFKVVGP